MCSPLLDAPHAAPRRARCGALALLMAAACCSATTRAAAEEPRPQQGQRQARNFVGIGPLFGLTGHMDTPVLGDLGLELSYVHYPTEAFRFGLGGFMQAQTVGFSHGRWAFGPQLNFMMFGVELGGFVEEGSYGKATTIGFHAAPFVSAGFFSAALRLGVPVGALSDGDPYGLDIGLVCTIKWPLPLDGVLFPMSFH